MEAKIQKLRESMLIKEGSKKTVFPQTIDKAVAAKWEGEYKSLDKVLNKKVATLLSYAAKVGEAEEYFLFSFANPSNKKELLKHITESHADFKAYITKNGTEDDIIELYDYVDSDINSLECLEQRTAFKCIKNLYLDKIYLHASSLPEYVIVDEDNNEYGNGDVIMFNSYPGKLYVKLKNIDADRHVDEIKSIILNTDSSSVGTYYIESTSGPQVYNDCIRMNTQWQNTAPSYRKYQDPNKYIKGDGTLQIATVNDIIDAHLKGTICFFILPSDYPSEVPASELPSSYLAETKKGEIKIEEVVIVNNTKQVLFYGIKPIKFTALFLPHPQGGSTPETPPFVFITHEQTATLVETNQWANQVFYQGVNTVENSTVTVSLSMNNNTFKIGLDDWDIDQYTNSFTVSAAKLEQGFKIRVMPFAYNVNTNAMMPALPVGTTSIDVICTYKNLDTNETTSQTHHIECIISEQNQAEYDEMVIETVVTSPKSSEDPGIAQLTLTGNLSDIWINKCEVYYYPMTISTFSTEASVIPGYDFIYSLTGDNTEVPQPVTSLHLTVEELTSRTLYLGAKVIRNYKGQAVVLGYIAFTGKTGNNKPISIEIPFDFTSEYSDEYEGPVEQQKEWLENMHLDYGYIPTIADDAKAINNMFSKEHKGALTTGSLLSVAALKKGEFKDLTNLESADFMQHMGITEIPNECFMNDESLTSVIIPDTVTRIGRHAFLGTALEEVVIPDSVTEIGIYAFAGCDNLTTVDIGKGVTLLRDTIFEHSSHIADVYLRNDKDVVRIDEMLGQRHQLFDEGMTVTLHVPDVQIEITNLDNEVEIVNLIDGYTDPNGRWMNIPNVTVNVVAIED